MLEAGDYAEIDLLKTELSRRWSAVGTTQFVRAVAGELDAIRMKGSMKSRNIVPVLCVVAFAPLLAHDLYVMPDRFILKPGQDLIVELHNGDAFPDSEGPPARERLHGTRILGNKGPIELKDFHEAHKGLATRVPIGEIGSGSFIITASLSANSRKYESAKFQAYLEDEGLTMVSKYRAAHREQDQPVTELYSKYAKGLIVYGTPSRFSTQPVGLTIEIIPDIDPATLKAGASMPVHVLFEGRPLAGLTIETTWTTGAPGKPSVVGITDSKGQLAIPLQTGKCRITTGYSQRYRDQSVANWETFFATLTFEVSR